MTLDIGWRVKIGEVLKKSNHPVSLARDDAGWY
jgi:hypothetical protein